MRVPIACRLSTEGATDRIEEWRAFFEHRVDGVERASAQCLRVRLGDSDDTLLRTVDLARREKACCPFFDFSIDVQRDALWLVVHVPADGVAILDDLTAPLR